MVRRISQLGHTGEPVERNVSRSQVMPPSFAAKPDAARQHLKEECASSEGVRGRERRERGREGGDEPGSRA